MLAVVRSRPLVFLTDFLGFRPAYDLHEIHPNGTPLLASSGSTDVLSAWTSATAQAEHLHFT